MLRILKDIKTRYWLITFIFLHVIAWTLAPALTRFTLPMDSMEGALWGRQLEWGYDKNPFMNGWLTALALKIDGHSGWAIYLFSQLSVAICFWAVWQLSKKIVPPVYALIAVLLLEGLQYFNFHAIDFNDNTLELATWSLTALFFYQAVRLHKLTDWLFTGLFAGLSMMTKYYGAMLFIPMALLLLTTYEGRVHFKKPGFYLAALVFLMIIAPHTIWLFSHDFVTLDYAMGRVASVSHWYNHLFFPAQFAWQQFEVLLPMLLLFSILLIGKKPWRVTPPLVMNSFDKAFLFWVGVGPLLLTVLLSVLTGMKLRAGWGQPLLSWWGLILVVGIQPYLTHTKFYRFMVMVFGFLILSVTLYSASLIRAHETSSANYPGGKIAAFFTTYWHDHYHVPLNYVAGSRWVAGNIAFYSSDRPQVFIDWDSRLSPWIDEKKLRKEGAIFVWDLSDDQRVSERSIQQRFWGMSQLQSYEFTWLRNEGAPKVKILVGFLPPEK